MLLQQKCYLHDAKTKVMQLRVFLLWVPMILIAVANGSFRQFVLLQYMDELRAHQLSTITLIIFCAVYLWFVFPALRIVNAKDALGTGVIFLLLTIAFEFGLGLANGKSWAFLLQDYNIMKGRIWCLFLAALFLQPYLLYRLKHKVLT